MPRFFQFTLLAFLALSQAGWAQKTKEPPPPSALRGAVVEGPRVAPTPAPAAKPTVFETAPEDEIGVVTPPLNLPRRVAQLMMVQLGSTLRPNNDDRLMLKDFTPGGVLITQISKPTRGAQYVSELRALPIERQYHLPLFIGANIYSLTQQGTMPDSAFPQLPSLLSLAAVGKDTETMALAEYMAKQLKTMGFNLHFGPSLALASPLSDAKNSVNTFGNDPEMAATASAVLFEAFRAQGIATAPVGFPGGGANRVDNSPAILLTPRSQLGGNEFIPFAKAVADGAVMLHVGPILVPTIEAEPIPACLSPIVMRDIIRNELNYDGLIVAGPMDDINVLRGRTPGEAAMEALRAGADMLFWMRSGQVLAKAIQDISRAVKDGSFDGKLVDDAFERVRAAKEKAKLSEFPLPDEAVARRLESRKDRVDAPYRVERRAITLVQNRGGVLPLTEEDSMPVGVTGVEGLSALHDALKDHLKHVARQPIVTAKHVGSIQNFEIERLTKYAKGIKTVVCIFDNDIGGASQKAVIDAFHELGARVVVVLLGYPALLDKLSGAEAIVVAYAQGTNFDTSMKAIADILVGKAPYEIMPPLRDIRQPANQPVAFDVHDVLRSPVGRLPVSISGVFEAGHSAGYTTTARIKRVEWDFGDGKTTKGERVEHVFATPGTYPVTLAVTDETDFVQSQTFSVVVE